MGATDIIKTLADKNSLRTFQSKPVTTIREHIIQSGPGLYIAGLDYHVGFLYNDGQEVYFIHSNYIQRAGVVKEIVTNSVAFAHSQFRITGKLNTDAVLLHQWLGIN